MLVSIVMPMRNAAPFVLESIQSVLAEKEVALELIIVDDGSTDSSADIVRSVVDSRIKLVTGPGRGIAACMNKGLSCAAGDVIMRCDSDDIYPPKRIKRQIHLLKTHSDSVAVCGALQMIDSVGRLLSNPIMKEGEDLIEIREELKSGHLRTSLCTFAIRRFALEILGGFREYFAIAEDVDFALRMGALGSVMYSPEVFYKYRIHEDSITHAGPNNRRIFFDQAAYTFALQRMKGGVDDLMLGRAPEPPKSDGSKSSAKHHQVNLLIGNAWALYRSKEYWRSIRLSVLLITGFPHHLSAWIASFKIIGKILFDGFFRILK